MTVGLTCPIIIPWNSSLYLINIRFLSSLVLVLCFHNSFAISNLDTLVTTCTSDSTCFHLLSMKKRPIFYTFVASTAVLCNIKRKEVTCPTHHGCRPLWSSANPQRLILTCANHHQTNPQKSICSSHLLTCHQS